MENDMKCLMKYVAEMGCIKINGVLFDLRDGEKLRVNFVDAGCSEVKDFYEKDLSGLLTLAVNDNGDFCLVKD